MMKYLLGALFFVAICVFITRLVPNNRNNINPAAAEITAVTNSTLTVNNVNPTFPTDEK